MMPVATKEIPILFSTLMMQALLDGRKKQTRRIVNESRAKPYRAGDVLWTCETFGYYRSFGKSHAGVDLPIYLADMDKRGQCPVMLGGKMCLVNVREPWKPSIFQPKALSRVRLPITSLRVERLQAITECDAIFEGWPGCRCGLGSVPWYRKLWGVINGEGSWASNPLVWVIGWDEAIRTGGVK